MRFEYKGKLIIELNTIGYCLPIKGDELFKYWFWNKDKSKGFHSRKFNLRFPNMQSYWMHMGQEQSRESLPINKIRGYSLDDLIKHWINTKLPFGYYVVMHDMNPQEKPANFWIAVPNARRQELLKDIVVLTCTDLRQVKEVCDSISTDFSIALGVQDGEVVYWNENFRSYG